MNIIDAQDAARKQRMHCCSAGSFEQLAGHLVHVVAINVFPRLCAINDGATINVWLLTSALLLIVDCVFVCGLCSRSLFFSLKE